MDGPWTQAAERVRSRLSLIVFFIMLATVGAAWWARFQLNEPTRIRPVAPAVEGVKERRPVAEPLKRLLAQSAVLAEPACTESACTVHAATLARPQAALHEALLRLPAPRKLLPPPGHGFRRTGPGTLNAVVYRAGSFGFAAVPLDGPLNGPLEEPLNRPLGTGRLPVPVIVDEAGHLVSGRAWRDGTVIPLVGRVAPRQREHRLPLLAEVQFQPVPTQFIVEPASAVPPALLKAERLRLHLEPAPDDLAPGAHRASATAVSLRVAGAAPGDKGWQFELTPRDVEHLLELRVSAAEARGGAPFPERIWVEQEVQGGIVPNRVPDDVVVSDAAGARVWVVVDGWAVPVDVEVLKRLPAHRIVAERPDPLGRPVRSEDWRQMGRPAREAVVRLQHQPGRAPAGLLNESALIVRQPAALVPGQRVRVGLSTTS